MQKWYVFTGRAYPKVVQGSNSTTRITSNQNDRESFYNDPAVVLSESDLDRFKGTEGKPLCVEHNLKDQVGVIHHSWIGDGAKRSLKIIGRVTLETPRGRQVVADIKAGKYKGLSVGYGTDLISNARTGVTELEAKNFREISLVADPFFDGCNLAEFGVTATKISNHNNGSENSRLILKVDASQEVLMEGQTQTPVPATELLAEADKLKSQLTEETKAKESQAQEVAQMKAELEQLRQLKERVSAKEKAEAEAYKASQMPKYEAYVTELAASKIQLTDAMKQDLMITFTDPRMKDGARHLEAEYTQKVELRASLKERDDRIKALEATMSKTTQVLNHSRNEFAAALGPKDIKEDESRKKVSISEDVNASSYGGDLSHIMNCEPTLEETGYMQTYGFRADNSGVNASSRYGASRPLVRSLPVAASHAHIYNEEGQLNNPDSARYGDNAHKLMFSWMCNNRDLISGDLSDVVRMREDKNTLERKEPLVGIQKV
jgi:hypothetical protein